MLKAAGEGRGGEERSQGYKGKRSLCTGSSLSEKWGVCILQSWASCNGPCLSPGLLVCFCSFVFLILLSDILKEWERSKATRGGEWVGQQWGGVG